MANDTLIALVRAECAPAIRPKDSLEDRCRAAMKAARGHWMVTDEDTQFKGAVTAVYLATADFEERKRIQGALDGLAAIAAMFAGVPVDAEQTPANDDALPLIGLWRETAS